MSFAARVTQRDPLAGRTVAEAMVTIATVHSAAVTVAEIRTLFDDDHVHAALIVTDGVLIAVIDRVDLGPEACDQDLAVDLGSLSGRVVGPDTPLAQAWLSMLRTGRRRLAVASADGSYRGLLCLKRSGAGFCSDQDVRARSADPSHRGPQ